MSAAIDPWAITPRERVKYQEQFRSLKPQNEIVTGQQARGFFLQSQLTPMILGEIWALADTDCDGKMDINEFSIACKLINLKLRGFEIPKSLPPALLASLTAVGGTPILTPTGIGALSPVNSVAIGNSIPPGRPALPPQPIHQQQYVPQQQIPTAAVLPGIGTMPMVSTQAKIIPPVPQAPIVPIQPMNNTTGVPVAVPIQSLIQPLSGPTIGQPPLVEQLINVMPVTMTPSGSEHGIAVAKPSGSLPAPPTPPSGTQSRSMSISDKVPSIESPGSATGPIVGGGPANAEWAIKGPAKLKYTQLFNTTDRTRSGYLTGAQARNLLVQSKLPQAILAQIWALSDMDSDGRLGCEEFVLAMYLCDLAIQGEAIPPKLPPELIPPTFRKTSSRHGSVASVSVVNSRHGSVSSQSGSAANSDAEIAAASLHGYNQTSFEDKRKENFDKGQAELERRRKVLIDIQRKEHEERERKEREEIDKREKARLEAERRQQEELERQLQIQREIEQEKEEKRKREIEQKEAARKEMEKQRQIEWENQRIAEMQQQRQREQEKVLKLKAQNQTYTIELGTLNGKIKELSQKICDTRVDVTSVKSVIDGMRSTRDTQMNEMATLKARIKEQNAKLVQLSQEKAKMDSKSKTDASFSQEAFSNKQIHINQLRGKLDSTKEEVESKQSDVSANTDQLTELKTQLSGLIDTCEDIYAEYETQRNQVEELKNNKKNDSMTTTWDTNASQDTWGTPAVNSSAAAVSSVTSFSKPGHVKYRAIYEFSARNADEITFLPGDIVMVPLKQHAEPGWLAGEINGHTGWFPETYVEKVDLSPTEAAEVETVAALVAATVASPVDQSSSSYDQGIRSSIPNDNKTKEDIVVKSEEFPADIAAESYNGGPTYYVSCYPYESAEIGDLTFGAGEYITVIKKDGDWWTGTIGTRTGIFPSNYVQEVGGPGDTYSTDLAENTTNNITSYDSSAIRQSISSASQNYSDDVRNQEEADTEVSEINTQSKTSENVQDSYSRPMSTSSTTSGLRGGKKGEVAQVIAPYEATSNEQLSLQRGQLIMIRKKTDSGWWEGELQARGKRRQIGWFPATYVKLLQSGRLSGRSTPVSGGKIQMSETILDKVIALFPYKAQNDDELSFEKDDIISVLGRDEPEWWRGECQGLTGLFPSNYVGPFVTSGNV